MNLAYAFLTPYRSRMLAFEISGLKIEIWATHRLRVEKWATCLQLNKTMYEIRGTRQNR